LKLQFKSIMVLCLLVAVPGILRFDRLRAAEIPAGAIKVRGSIKATSGSRRAARAATLTTAEKKVYSIVLDPRGRSLVQVMHRERAEVWALPLKKNGADWLQVLSYADPKLTAGGELWRRMRCNACVVLPATINAAQPKKLRGAQAVTGRYYPFREMYSSSVRDKENLWLATGEQLVRISLKERKVLRTYDRSSGLPDSMIYQLVSDGKTLWVAQRCGVASLDIATGKISAPEEFKASYAKILVNQEATWVITDRATFRVTSAKNTPEKFPPIPSAVRIARVIKKGIWTPHWERRTGHLLSALAVIKGKLMVSSYGNIYQLAEGKWTTVANRNWQPVLLNENLWYLNSGGLNQYQPDSGKSLLHKLPDGGTAVRLLASGQFVWVAAYPVAKEKDAAPVGGGLARFDTVEKKWQSFALVKGTPTDRICAMASVGSQLWVVALLGKNSTKSAHPGMTTTRRNIFETTGMKLLHFGPADEKKTVGIGAGTWSSYDLPREDFEKRLICGQDGKRGMDTIVPEFIEKISVGPKRIFAATRLVPRKYFGGYWPCINGIASRESGSWKASFEHKPAQLGLEGQQPAVLNISNGELSRVNSSLKNQLWEAVGHDMVLDLFYDRENHWAVTSGGAAFFDLKTGKWQRLAEAKYRWYWRVSAALEDQGWLYIGSDRGLISRMEIATGKFEHLGTIKNRSISRIEKDDNGNLLFGSQLTQLGQLPVHLKVKLKELEAVAAIYDGQQLKVLKTPSSTLMLARSSEWSFRKFVRRGHFDKTRGNFLCKGKVKTSQIKPSYYLKEVFFPLFLCSGNNENRMWVSTYTGMVRLDLSAKAPVAEEK
jgi:hypothetical protein